MVLNEYFILTPLLCKFVGVIPHDHEQLINQNIAKEGTKNSKLIFILKILIKNINPLTHWKNCLKYY